MHMYIYIYRVNPKAPQLTWLDFVGRMLSEDGNSLPV